MARRTKVPKSSEPRSTIYSYTSVDPPQDCGGVWLDMSIVGSVMHVSSSRLSSNLYGTCGLLDLSCMFRHQVRTRPGRSPEGCPGRKDRPVRSLEGRLGRKDRPVRTPGLRQGLNCRPKQAPARLYVPKTSRSCEAGSKIYLYIYIYV